MKTQSHYIGAVLAAAVVGSIAFAGSASAAAPTICTDGTVIGDIGKPRPCPKLTSSQGQQHAKAPKPTNSSKKWRDYINEGYKPKPRPKP